MNIIFTSPHSSFKINLSKLAQNLLQILKQKAFHHSHQMTNPSDSSSHNISLELSLAPPHLSTQRRPVLSHNQEECHFALESRIIFEKEKEILQHETFRVMA
ncbi:unnamed protein product [Cuscuta europaea]|uniref:Uncharacterized protein n=1 Tax=Cuscuta europaea TaxID=41803 RepID=A0A9P1EGF4_CUSEU|nr:unnamed protein product [Cuscuta europaea]